MTPVYGIVRTAASAFLAVLAVPGYAGTTPAEPTNPSPNPQVQAATSIDAGRYLVTIGACNDCHTVGWDESNGQLAEENWLTGSAMGWRGPWGTSYPGNLRLLVHEMSEDAWVAMLRSRKGLPPMPWMNVNKISENDARAMYRFISSLGPKGEKVPRALAPNTELSTAYLLMEPIAPKPIQAKTRVDE